MADNLLDELARALAEPMPRRRVLRLAAAAFVGGVVPGVSAGQALSAPMRSGVSCPPDTKMCKCPSEMAGKYAITCCPTNLVYVEYTCECFSGSNGEARAQCTARRTCPETRAGCGPCCPVGQRCNTLLEKCECANGKPACGTTCCREGQPCCGGVCCVKGQVCKAGKCSRRCPQDQTPCGLNTCCPKNWRCANASKRLCKKCAKGQDACGPKCCQKGTYCCNEQNGTCCTHKNGSCCGDNQICCEGTDCCTTKAGGARCCLKGQTCATKGTAAGLVTAGSPNVCCPEERVVNLDSRSVCCPPGYLSLGGKLVVPIGGGGGLCCADDRVCGSGKSVTCCASNPALGIDQVCRDGKCVDA